MYRWLDIQIDKYIHIYRQIDKQMVDRQMEKYMYRIEKGRQIGGKVYRQMDEQMGKQINNK